ncbi:MAG: hypothetical protein COT43_07800 [Candidatus Marinimicrobia bacterium CG08_land_8_20_14_0_20_45_22]|nr:MAG: hypothetical protein COT43_07800 [Candidatus Marinimicrobia bacterium CG08_land_8_20_14_0_20_45_22]
MMKIDNFKLNKWILIAGITLLLFGLILYSIVNVWNWKLLTLIGIGLAGSVYAFIRLDMWKFLKDRRLLYSGNMAFVIIVTIAILILVNFFLARHTWRIDSTTTGTFSLSDQTIKVLKGLNKEVEIFAFAKDLNKSSVEDRLKEYSHYTKRLTWEIVDPDEKPTIAKKYKVKNYGYLVVLCEGKEEQVPTASEESITNAIIKVTREGNKKIAFVTGHGESDINSSERDGFAKAKEAILEQNYDVSEIQLAGADSIPADVSVLIIAGPKKDFFDSELALLTKHINNGGGALFMLDPRPSAGLIDYMKNWFVEVGDNLLIDISGIGRLFGAGPEIPLISDYTSHPIVKDMKGIMTFFPMARSVKAMSTEGSTGILVDEIALTGANSYAVSNVDQVLKTGRVDIKSASAKGSIPVICATTIDLKASGMNGQSKARIVTVGDSDFASNAYFPSQGNGDLFMNIVSWLLSDEDLISIRPKAPDIRLVEMSPAQIKTVFWLTVIILPAIAFGIGIMVFIRRK